MLDRLFVASPDAQPRQLDGSQNCVGAERQHQRTTGANGASFRRGPIVPIYTPTTLEPQFLIRMQIFLAGIGKRFYGFQLSLVIV
jgi:hypothetical protein